MEKSSTEATTNESATNRVQFDDNNQQNGSNNQTNDEENTEKISYIRKLWIYRKYFIIEPFVLCWILPACFLYISIQNLALEKACRVNLEYPKSICDNVIDKTLSGIDCEQFDLAAAASTSMDENTANSTNDENNNNTIPPMVIALMTTTTSTANDLENLTYLSYDFNSTVCRVEKETQKEITFINGIRAPIASIFPIIVILFAGGWSDKKGVRKPCMIFPMIGEALSATALLISSIFFDSIPMEFGSFCEKVLPAMFGGSTLMIMGIYSYLTAATEEKDRTFRFGIFAVFASVVQFIGLPFSGTLYTQLGYVYVFLLSDIIIILGVFYMIFIVSEVKTPPAESTSTEGPTIENGQENPAFELTEVDSAPSNTNKGLKTITGSNNNPQDTSVTPSSSVIKSTKTTKKKNFFMEFFDPTLALDCIRTFIKKRPNNGRLYIILLVFTYFLFIGPASGELDYTYVFALITLNIDVDSYSIYNTYSTLIVLIGTSLMTGVFSKIFRMSDAMLGFIASIGTVISRPMFAFSKGLVLLYAATTVDLFVSIKAIAVKSIISSFVAVEELGRIYSIIGIFDAFAGFVFPPIYSAFYSQTVDTFPGAFFLLSIVFFVPTVIIFALVYFLVRKNSNETQENIAKKDDEEQQNTPEATENGKEIESTYM